MAKIKTPANLKKWHTSFIDCVKEHDSDEDVDDHTARYIYGFAISPEAHQLGKEYGILAEAIKKENGHVFEQYFGTSGLEEITVEDDIPFNGLGDITRFYDGEKWGFVYSFTIETFIRDGKTGYIDAEHGRYFYYLPEHPLLLIDALNMFNALSFENTTHVIRLHQMWNCLRKIRDTAFDFEGIMPSKRQGLDEPYSKFFIPIDKVRLKPASKKRTGELIKLINAFQRDYKIRKDDYFKDIAEMKREAKWVAYDYKNAFEAYFGQILRSYAYFLKEHKALKTCEYCGNAFKYAENKSFCSEKDGSNCGQTVRNKRFYKKNRKILLPKARRTARELRQLYKEHGIKK